MSNRCDFLYDENLAPSNHMSKAIVKALGTDKINAVLDIGCGNGGVLRVISRTFPEIATLVGIEPAPSGVETARKLVPKGVFYKTAVDVDPNEINEGPFDAVLSVEVIEHLHYPADLLRLAKAKLLKPSKTHDGGRLIITTPYHGYLKNMVLSLLNQWDKGCRSPLWIGGHAKFWTFRTIRTLLEQEGFEIINFIGCGGPPLLWRSMVLVCTIKRQK